MAMKHQVQDSDVPFSINTSTRKIVNNSNNKTSLMQGDHNSERFTFLVPRKIEEHDMYMCDAIKIHYENTSIGTSTSARRTYRGVTEIEDRRISSMDEEVFSFSWLVPETATMFAGTLKFQLEFICYDNTTTGVTGYKWHTDVNDDITITPGLPSSSGDIKPSTIVNLQSIEIIEIPGGIDIILDGIHHKLYNGSGGGGMLPSDVETTSNKVTSINSSATDTQYPSAKAVLDLVNSIAGGGTLPSNVETTSNKVTSINSSATDTQYPSAKAVLDLVNSIAGGSVPAASTGLTGTILQVENGTYVLKSVSQSSVGTYVNQQINALIISALNTDVEV